MSSLNSMIENYEKMDIIGDTVFLTVLKNFKDRLLNNYTAEQLRSDESLCKMILDEISVMISTASDQAVIAELANQYRQKIGL
jgi:hypothetical protein